MTGAHWVEWHAPYGDPDSPLSQRLATVQAEVRRFLNEAPPGPQRAISMCAGQGRDLIEVLADHPRDQDVTARLVELDPTNADIARQRARAAGLGQLEVVVGDAGLTDAYAGAVPADLVLVCGVFGNIDQADMDRTVAALPGLCAPGATVVWTRHRRPPDVTPRLRRSMEAAGLSEAAFHAPSDYVFAVGVNRLTVPPASFTPGARLFTFVGDGARPA